VKSIAVLCIILLALSPGLHSQTAPVTAAGIITDAAPGDTSVPVDITVNGFTNIGHFTLTLKFDTTRVRFVSAIPNPSLEGMSISYSSPSGNTQGKLILAWTGSGNISLEDGASLAGLTFHYVTGTGLLKWSYSFGTVCIYKRYNGTTLSNLIDTPKSQYYLNGGISEREAPVIIAPVLADPVQGPLPVVLSVTGFTDIHGFTLYLEYDPAVITFMNSFVKNPAFDANFLVGDNPGTGGKRLIVIQWYGAEVNLPDSALLCTLSFNYPAAVCDPCPFYWYDNGPTCQFSGPAGDVLIDMPQSYHYIDGLIEPGLASVWTGNVSNDWQDTGNWAGCGMPEHSMKVIIPFVSTGFYPVISSEFDCHSLEIQPGASLLISPTGNLSIGN